MSQTRQYELVYIVGAETGEQEIADLHTQVEQIVQRFNGTLDKTENWGRRKLAYEISHHREGTYVVETISGSDVKFKMLPIPGGSFTMGSLAREFGRAEDEGPQHEVTMAPFWMGEMEVTWDEYDLFAFDQGLKKEQSPQPANAAGADAVTRPTPPYADETFGFGRGRQPVISITHHAAMEYCRWLSHKTGKSCLYVKRLSDVDGGALRELIERSVRVARGVDTGG